MFKRATQDPIATFEVAERRLFAACAVQIAGRVTESLLTLVPRGGVLAIDPPEDMVTLARSRLGDRARVWCQDVLDLDLAEPVDVIVSTAALHWVSDHDRMWGRLAGALRPGGILEVQCGGEGNIARVREVIDRVARDAFPELVGWSPWVFASPQETERRLRGRRTAHNRARPARSDRWQSAATLPRANVRTTEANPHPHRRVWRNRRCLP